MSRGQGWYNNPYGHRLASKGIVTKSLETQPFMDYKIKDLEEFKMKLRASIEKRRQKFFDQITPENANVVHDQLKEFESSQEFQLGYLEGYLDVLMSLKHNPLKKEITEDPQYKKFVNKQSQEFEEIAEKYDNEIPEKSSEELGYIRTRTSYWWGYLNAQIDFEHELGSIDHKRFK